MTSRSPETTAPTRPDGRTRVLIVDDNHARAELLGIWVDRREDEYVTVGYHHCRRGLVEVALRERPDVVVLDLTMPEDSLSEADHDCGRRCANDLEAALPDVRILIVSRNGAAQALEVADGGRGRSVLAMQSLTGPDRTERFYRGLDAARDGCHMRDGRLRDRRELVQRCGLEPRHLDLLPWLFHGIPTKDICAARHLSRGTVDGYRSEITARVSAGLGRPFKGAAQAADAFYGALGIVPDCPSQ